MKEIRLLDGKWVCNGSIYDPFGKRYIEGDLPEDGLITKDW